ncbi:MAG: site-2 protease family protein [Deltaproteobacteria bacterium]|nr:site-2 protease family protein [Deltaproteobacteria bacterium]
MEDRDKIYIPDIITRDGRIFNQYTTPKKKFPYINIILFIITLITTTLAGAGLEGITLIDFIIDPIKSSMKGLPFSITLICILLTHEMGHFFTAKKHRVEASLPYFIPAPFGVGTFGAIIKMKSPLNSRKSLIDIGAAGPISGFIVATIATIYGIQTSNLIRISDLPDGGIRFQDPLIVKILQYLLIGPIPHGYDMLLNSVGFAGWLGMLVTSLNLLPIGQLDGGHIAYALFGNFSIWISRLIFFILIFLGIFLWQGWLLWGFISYFIIGLRHPPLRPDADINLDTKHKIVAYICIMIFILTFMPSPILEIKK